MKHIKKWQNQLCLEFAQLKLKGFFVSHLCWNVSFYFKIHMMYPLCSLCMTKGGDENLVDKRVYWSWLIMHAIFQMAHDYSLEAALSAATKQNMFKCHFGNLLRNCFSFRANLSPKGMLCLVIETFLGTKVSSFIMLIRNILTAEQKSKPNKKWPSTVTSSGPVSAKNSPICYALRRSIMIESFEKLPLTYL